MFTCWSVISTINAGFGGHRPLHLAIPHMYVECCKYPSFASPIVFSGILSWRWVSMPQKLIVCP